MRVTGTQPGIFGGRTGFLEQGRFNKHFMHNTQKKGSAGENVPVFLQDILKTAFEMRIELIDAHRQSNVFQNQGAICLFSKAIGETSHPSPFQLQAEVNLFSLKRLRQHLFFLYGNDQVQQKFTFDFKNPSFIWLVAILV